MHGASIDGFVVIGEQSFLGSDVFDVGGGPFGEEFDEIGMEWDEAVVAEFADRDA